MNVTQPAKPVRVLVVDDSAFIRMALTKELAKFPEVEVVGSAMDPYDAREKIAQLRPDVLTLDVEMPRMDGLTFLEKLMAHAPMPVVMVSSLTPQGSDMAIRALALGAVSVVPKPGSSFARPDCTELASAIQMAAAAKPKPLLALPFAPAKKPPAAAPGAGLRTTHKVLAIGASTGGTQAIEHVLRGLPPDLPGTVVVQHIPAHFSGSFAQRLNAVCSMEVREARDGDRVLPGLVLVAPGNYHLTLERSGAMYHVRLNQGPPVHYQRPAVDVLFESVARNAGANAVGVILTGMGADGAQGLLAMRQKGAKTLAQDEASSVVFGMPKQAILLGAAESALPLSTIPAHILKLAR